MQINSMQQKLTWQQQRQTYDERQIMIDKAAIEGGDFYIKVDRRVDVDRFHEQISRPFSRDVATMKTHITLYASPDCPAELVTQIHAHCAMLGFKFITYVAYAELHGILSTTTVPASRKKEESSDSSESDSEEEDNAAKAAAPLASKSAPVSVKKGEESSESSESESSEADSTPTIVKMPSPEVIQFNSSSDEDEDDDSEESSDEEPIKKTPFTTIVGKPKKNSSSDEDESSEEESEEEKPTKTPKKMDNDVEMKDASVVKSNNKKTTTKSKELQAPVTPSAKTTGSKSLFVGNLSFNVEQADVEEFFKDAGEVVRFASNKEGCFKGFRHVEFATPEEAQKALELNGQELLGRALKIDLAHERGSYTPHSGKENNSFQKGGRGGLGPTKYMYEVSTNPLKRIRMAFLEFKDNDSFSKALELNGEELGGYSLTVEEARPRDGDSGRGVVGVVAETVMADVEVADLAVEVADLVVAVAVLVVGLISRAWLLLVQVSLRSELSFWVQFFCVNCTFHIKRNNKLWGTLAKKG
ncbi:uncharacterized protein LOC143892783 isoform X2 [Tasmannia lanceolata]|uniref:uncharacterized protein LOC143892783 isoform X2 n=1 Tax=Tasmannia lanceolata TaxID=3420 RepID=UPI004063CC57